MDRSILFQVLAPQDIMNHGKWVTTPVVIDGTIVLQINCQVEDISSFQPPQACWNICDATATHEYNGTPVCKRHYDYWIEFHKEQRELARLYAERNPPPVESCEIDCTTRGQVSHIR